MATLKAKLTMPGGDGGGGEDGGREGGGGDGGGDGEQVLSIWSSSA